MGFFQVICFAYNLRCFAIPVNHLWTGMVQKSFILGQHDLTLSSFSFQRFIQIPSCSRLAWTKSMIHCCMRTI